MTVDAFESIILGNGMELAEKGDDGLPQLPEDEVFESTFEQTSLVIGSDHDLGPGSVHTTTRCLAPGAPAYRPTSASSLSFAIGSRISISTLLPTAWNMPQSAVLVWWTGSSKGRFPVHHDACHL